MSWITFIWSVAAGSCLTLMGVHFLGWFGARESWANFFLSLSAAGAAACITFELALMYSQTTEQAGEMIQWMQVPIGLTVVSLVWFIHLYLQAGHPWLVWLVVMEVLAKS